MAEIAGADQITCHIRGDRRHIIDADLPRLRDAVQTQLNVEMAATQEMCALVIPILAEHPHRHRITLVPEREGEVTTEGGLDVVAHKELIQKYGAQDCGAQHLCQPVYRSRSAADRSLCDGRC